MVPNCGVFTKRSGVPRLTWFKALKNSARNWNFIRSTRLNSRASAKSIVWRPGPMTVLRPTSPKVKAGGVEKAFGLNHSAAVCVPGRSEEHTSELQSRLHLVCRLLLEKKKNTIY